MLSIRARLSIMMFLQFFVWGAWGVEMGGYLGNVLKFTGAQIGGVYQSTAIAAMVSPLFMGYVADRFFSTEKVLGVLHLAGGFVLAWAAMTTTYPELRYVMIGYALLFMPTLALSNSISFDNMTNPDREFPMIRVFGTLGWIAAGLVVGFGLRSKTDTAGLFAANNFIWLAAGSSLLLGLFCFSLPYTPPKGPKAANPMSERKSVLGLLADPSFLIFTIASFLICIPLAFYYNLANVFLAEIHAPVPTALQTIGQISEVFFMAAMPMFIAKLGVKRMLAIGMLAWVVRYFSFGSLQLPLIVFGLVLHGICYDFFFVASQIYVDSQADLSQRARAQSFIAFVTLGLGMFVGAWAAGTIADRYPAPVQVTLVDKDGKTLTDADGKARKTTLPVELAPQSAQGSSDDKTKSEDKPIVADLVSERGKLKSFKNKGDDKPSYYRVEDLEAAIKAADTDEDGTLTRAEWITSAAHDWFHVWLWPAVMAAGALLLFWFGFRYRPTPSAS